MVLSYGSTETEGGKWCPLSMHPCSCLTQQSWEATSNCASCQCPAPGQVSLRRGAEGMGRCLTQNLEQELDCFFPSSFSDIGQGMNQLVMPSDTAWRSQVRGCPLPHPLQRAGGLQLGQRCCWWRHPQIQIRIWTSKLFLTLLSWMYLLRNYLL